MKFLTALFLAALLSPFANADWKAEKKKYDELKNNAEKMPPRADYQIRRNGETIAVSARPELGMNIHKLDAATAATLKKAGIGMVRQTVYWYRYEKTKQPGVYDEQNLKELDRRFAEYRKYGLEPLAVVHGNAPGTGFANRIESYRRFGKFMAMLAKRCPTVKYFQLWNEMDAAFTDLFGARNKEIPMLQRGKYYAEMLKIVYPMLKEANPEAVIVTGGMTNWSDFPKGIYEGGGKEYFDVLALHTYGMPMPWSFIIRGNAVRSLMDRCGDERKPLWNTEFGVSAEAAIKAWGIPEKDPLKRFDDIQCNQIMECIRYNQQAQIFSRYFIYAYHAGSEANKEMKEKLSRLIPGCNFDDISFSLVRHDGTCRKTMQELIRRKPHFAKKKSCPAADAEWNLSGTVLYRKGKPFFPLGLVFGRTDADMQRAKAAGLNSIHQEYSIRDVFPNSPDELSQEGVRRIRNLHETARKNGMVLFPLLTGHYIPGWLAKIAGKAPHDINGRKIGLWFPYSIHDSIYRNTLKKFWETVAENVGNDENAPLFVTWNEPAYGLDASPAALNKYREKMRLEYKTVAAFNRAMKTEFEDFGSILPPACPDGNRTFFYHWYNYNAQAFADFFQWQKGILKQKAPGIKLSAKHPVTVLLGDALYCNDIVLQAENQDVYGCDAYNGSLLHYRDAMEAARSLSGGGPVISYETHAQAGIPPLKPENAPLQLFVQILGGCRGLFFFCNGEQPAFGLFSDKATPPPVREKLIRFFHLVNRNQDVFAAERAPAEIAVLQSSISNLHYGCDPVPSKRDEYTKRLSQTYDLIRNQHFAVDFISEKRLGKLKNYKLLIIPSRTILTDSQLKQVGEFHKNGGRLLVFGGTFERDEFFAGRNDPPDFLGLKKREPAPWNRGQMRIVEVPDSLAPYFPTELIVQSPERVNPLPMEQAIPGYIPKTKLDAHIWLAANQDAYPSIVMSNDKQVVYCAFDSLYTTELSRLLGGILEKELGLRREMTVRRKGGEAEAVELLSSITRNGGERYVLLANSGPQKGEWEIQLAEPLNGACKDIVSGKEVLLKNGKFSIALDRYGFAALRRKQ